MTSIDRARQALEILRRQTAGARSAGKFTQPFAAASGAMASQVSRQGVLARMRALPREDPDHQRKAIRIFVDAALTAEFGQHAVNAAEYQDMVDAVLDQITDDVVLCRHFLDTIAQIEAVQ